MVVRWRLEWRQQGCPNWRLQWAALKPQKLEHLRRRLEAAMVAVDGGTRAAVVVFKFVRERESKRGRGGGLERWKGDRVFAKR